MSTPIAFIPFILVYMNGDPVGVYTAKEPIATQAECLKEAQDYVSHLIETGVPPGGSILGGCLPVPPAPPAAKESPDKPTKSSKGPLTTI